tara:strand:+ start:234 stop:839 length:606 start_codon:yes stop_codon:yes gene_type:complete
MLALNFGSWQFWETYDPSSGFFGAQKVTFDGINKLILINSGITEIDFRIDVYSNWKEWSQVQTNSRFEQALNVVGGDPLPGFRVLGSTFFLENGWKIRSWEGNHLIDITGNVFSRDGSDPVLPTLGNFKVTVNFTVSTLVEALETGVILGIDSVTQLDEVHKIHGLDADNDLIVTDTTRDAGTSISQTIAEAVGTVTIKRV